MNILLCVFICGIYLLYIFVYMGVRPPPGLANI